MDCKWSLKSFALHNRGTPSEQTLHLCTQYPIRKADRWKTTNCYQFCTYYVFNHSTSNKRKSPLLTALDRHIAAKSRMTRQETFWPSGSHQLMPQLGRSATRNNCKFCFDMSPRPRKKPITMQFEANVQRAAVYTCCVQQITVILIQ